MLLFDGPDPLADPAHAEWLRDALTVEQPPERFLPGLADSERRALLRARLRALDLNHWDAQVRDLASERDPRRWQERLRHAAHGEGLERRLWRALEKADAQLHSYSETNGPDGRPVGLIVDWSERGQRHRYRTVLGRGLDVVSSGICLSDRDHDFDLTSLVSVMAGSPWSSR